MEKKDQKMNKKRRLKKRNIFFIIMIFLVLVFVYMFSKQYKSFNRNNMSQEEINEKSYNSSKIMRADLSDIKTIKFDLATTDVRIQRSTTNPYIEYTNLYKGDDNSYEVKVNFQDGKLEISNERKGEELYMKNKIQVVRIFLPMEGSLEKIEGKIGAGEVKISDCEVKDMNLTLESGDILFENSFFGGKVNVNSGSIALNKTEVNQASLTTKVGDIIAKDVTIGAGLDATTETGSITLTTKDSLSKYQVAARLDIGNFILGNVSYRNILDGYITENKATKKVNLKTKIGNITFNKGEGAKLEEEEEPDRSLESNSSDDKENDISSDESTPSVENSSSDEDVITPVDEDILDQNKDLNEDNN